MYVKWAHKIDAPGLNDVPAEGVTVSIEASLVKLTAKHAKKTFRLEIPLAGQVDVAKSTHTKVPFGRKILLIKAEADEVWPGIMPSSAVVPQNAHMWQELWDQYRDELERVSKRTPIMWLEELPDHKR